MGFPSSVYEDVTWINIDADVIKMQEVAMKYLRIGKRCTTCRLQGIKN